MNREKATIDQRSVEFATDIAIERARDCIAGALGYTTDNNRSARRASLECKTCYYIYTSRIGGAAMTTRPCGICSVEQLYSSTNTDKICLNCAKNYSLCKYCGADLELRPRRKFSTGLISD